MNFEQLMNKKVAVLGLGIEGAALANFLSQKVKKVSLLDKMSRDELEDRAKEENQIEIINILNNNSFEFMLGPSYLDRLDRFDLIFRSPGIPYLNRKIQNAKKAAVVVSSQIKLFFDLCPCPIIGVTGTKGKGTTATLIFEMLKKSQTSNLPPRLAVGETGKLQIYNSKFKTKELKPRRFGNVYLAGNIGEPAITLIDKLSKNDTVVLELSSFQLQDLNKSPHIAVIVNLSLDHLDYHQTESEYHQAKLNIVKYQNKEDYSIINQDYLTSYQFATETVSQVYYFSGKDSVDQGSFIRKITPTELFHRKKTENNNETTRLDSARFDFAQARREVDPRRMEQSSNEIHEVILRTNDKEEVICRSSEVKLIGKHNLENIAAAGVAAYLSGADIKSISSAAKLFAGLPHRLEFVQEIDGVAFYNDSYATNPEPTIAAIDSFDKPIHIILGGSGKKADFTKLANKIAQSKVKSVFLIGEEQDNILACLKKSNYIGKINLSSGDFDQIIKKILGLSKPLDVVLLSPACASFGLFKNYKDRGEKFKQAVSRFK